MDDKNAVDSYIDALDSGRRATLQAVRSLIMEAVPGVEETLRYRMPTYEIDGRVVCALASQKHHLSLYMEPDLVEKHADELAGLSVGKSCIRFTRLEDLPMATVRAILQKTVRQEEPVTAMEWGRK